MPERVEASFWVESYVVVCLPDCVLFKSDVKDLAAHSC